MKSFTAVGRKFILGILIALAGSAAAQQPYPTRPIRIIVPYAAGSALDILARLVGPKLTQSWGQPVIVENRPGGNTVIGYEAFLKSPPDGYTLMLNVNSHVLIPLLLPVTYDPIKDFAPVATISSIEFILVIHPSVPANNLQELIGLAKANPGKLNYASSGTGASSHLAVELFANMAEIKMQHIPYKGSPLALNDLVSGQVQMFFSTPSVSLPLIKSGRIKAIAVSGATRMPALPQVPTFSEAGLPDFDVKTWMGVLVRAGTPKEIIDKQAAEIARILNIPEFKEQLTTQGLDPYFSTPEQFAALVKTDLARYAKVIKAANIKID